MRIYPTEILRGFALTICLWLIVGIVPTAQGQQPTPRPTSGGSTEVQALNAIIERLETMSGSDATTLNGATLLMGFSFVVLTIAVLIGVIWVVRGGLSPLFAMLRREQARADDAEQSETRMRTLSEKQEQDAQKLRTQQAQALDHMAGTLDRVATKMLNMDDGQNAQKRTDAAVEKIITDVNAHTDTTLEETKEKLEAAAVNIQQAKDVIDDVATKDDLARELDPILKKLDEIASGLQKKGDSNPHLPVIREGEAHDAQGNS